MQLPSMAALCGLGNPGEEYIEHRHNIGFMVIDHIRKKHISSDHKKHNGIIYKTEINEHPLHMIKPQTYMNSSGICLKKWLTRPKESQKVC